MHITTRSTNSQLKIASTTTLNAGTRRQQNPARSTDAHLDGTITDCSFTRLPLTTSTQLARTIRVRYVLEEHVGRISSEVHVIEVNVRETETGAITAESVLLGAKEAETTAMGIDTPEASAPADKAADGKAEGSTEAALAPVARVKEPAPIPVGRCLSSGKIQLASNATLEQLPEVTGQLQAGSQLAISLRLERQQSGGAPNLTVVLQ